MDEDNEASNASTLSEPLLALDSEEAAREETAVPSDNKGGDNDNEDDEETPSSPPPLPDRSPTSDDDDVTSTMESLSHVGHVLHRLPFGKKLVSALAILAAGVVTTEEMLDEWSHHRPHHDEGSPPNPPKPTATRLERATFCASRISASVGVGNAPFDGGNSPQVRAVDWFVEGGGRGVEVDVDRCDGDGLFSTLYSLQVLRFSAGIAPSVWDGGGGEVSDIKRVCKWNRVGCDDHDTFVTRLHLSDLGMEGTLPAEIARLSRLERLELYDNPGLAGTVPPALSQMDRLRFLYLHHTSVGGTLPAVLASLVHLEELFVEGTDLEGAVPKGVCALRNTGALKELHADCKGGHPMLECVFPSCCSKCYNHKADV